MSSLINEALKVEDISDLYYDREATLTGIDNYIKAVETLHAKDTHTRYSIEKYYKLKAEIPQILDKAKEQNNELLAALYKYNIGIKKDAQFLSDQIILNNKMDILEEKFSQLSEKLETSNAIPKPVAAAPVAPSSDLSEAIKLISKQISDAQQVMNKQISDAQGVTNKNISDS